MYKLRGDKISMIFQDPLSSLNPIVKIGKQITEAMLLKNKTSRKEAKNEFNSTLATLQKNIAVAIGDEAKAKSVCQTFDKFCIKANELENSYNSSLTVTEDTEASIRDFLFRVEKKGKVDVKASLKQYADQLKKITDPYLVAAYADKLNALTAELNADGSRSFRVVRGTPDGKSYAKDIAAKYGLGQEDILGLVKK